MESIGWALERAACARQVRGWEEWARELEGALARARSVGGLEADLRVVVGELDSAVVAAGRTRVASARAMADAVCGFGEEAGRVDAEVVRRLAELVGRAGTGRRS